MRHGVSAARRLGVSALLGMIGFGLPWAGSGQSQDSVRVVPGPQYRAGWFKRFVAGSDYRDLWTTRITVPVLDLRAFAGGLKPTREGGGEQTHSLRLEGADGREYQFRSVDKDAAGALPEELRRSLIAKWVHDQTSSTYPAGPVVPPPILQAAGILHPVPIVYRMPDDSLLGEFRAHFAGMLGTIEERPDSGFAGSPEVLDTDEMFERLNRDPAARLDSREYLTARLVDLLLGDWDRHRDQWEWARFGDTWRPVPRDRDAVFSRYDGFVVNLVRLIEPRLQQFEADYPSLGGLTRNGREIDRRLLSGLERETWDSVALWLRGRLTDSVLIAALNRMPLEFRELRGSWLLQALKHRRDRLPEIASDFYLRQAQLVEVTATDVDDVVAIERETGGSTLVTIQRSGVTVFRRRFLAQETGEVRLFLRDGDDRISIEQVPGSRQRPLIRVVGGPGNDRYVVQGPTSAIRLYDESVQNQVEGRLSLDPKPWPWDADSIWYTARPPDRGIAQRALPALAIAPDVGVVFGIAGHIDWYGFRRIPFSSRFSYLAEFSTTRRSGRLAAAYSRQLENSPAFFRFWVQASGIEALRWYGFGNRTVEEEPPDFYRVRRNDLVGGLGFGIQGAHRLEVTAGPLVRYSTTPLTDLNATRFIAENEPYGVGHFLMAGLAFGLQWDSRDVPGFARKGAALRLRAEAYPGWLDADAAVARLGGQASVAVAPLAIGSWQPSLHLMGGGEKTFGKLPYFLAPTLGGRERLRGYSFNRFAGEATLYGSAELRLPVLRASIVVPGEQGLFGFFDVGKAFLDGEPASDWHHSYGGGVWLSFLRQRSVVYLAAAWPDRREEGGRILFGFGFPY